MSEPTIRVQEVIKKKLADVPEISKNDVMNTDMVLMLKSDDNFKLVQISFLDLKQKILASQPPVNPT